MNNTLDIKFYTINYYISISILKGQVEPPLMRMKNNFTLLLRNSLHQSFQNQKT